LRESKELFVLFAHTALKCWFKKDILLSLSMLFLHHHKIHEARALRNALLRLGTKTELQTLNFDLTLTIISSPKREQLLKTFIALARRSEAMSHRAPRDLRASPSQASSELLDTHTPRGLLSGLATSGTRYSLALRSTSSLSQST